MCKRLFVFHEASNSNTRFRNLREENHYFFQSKKPENHYKSDLFEGENMNEYTGISFTVFGKIEIRVTTVLTECDVRTFGEGGIKHKTNIFPLMLELPLSIRTRKSYKKYMQVFYESYTLLNFQ